MSYQNVGTPRFYINEAEWFSAVSGSAINDVYRTLPVNIKPVDIYENVPGLTLPEQDNHFGAVLGHTYAADVTFYSPFLDSTGGNMVYNHESIVNGDHPIPYNGFSIMNYGSEKVYKLMVHASIGSAIVGTYYDMPHSPNLSLTMAREYGGTKEFTTHNGSSMSNTMWTKPPAWGDLGAWELTSGTELSRSGRRTWDLSFSYLDDGDLFGSNQSLQGDASGLDWTHVVFGTWGGGDGTVDVDDDWSGDAAGDTSVYHYNIISDYNFFSQVWHKTLGGTLPFIFQPDANNNNPDQFSICRFVNNSLKATQSAFRVYDISLKIEEVW